MSGFIIETPNQCWHVAAYGKTLCLTEYPNREECPPYVFSERADAEWALDALKDDRPHIKLKIVEIP